MSIIITRDGKPAVRIDRSGFADESELQRHIQENPLAIPLQEIDETLRQVVVAREFPVESGSIDAIALDQNGDIYLIETKLYKNADKRQVIAQVLDYGASLWTKSSDPTSILAELDGHARKLTGRDLDRLASEELGVEEEGLETWRSDLRSTISDGRYRHVVLLDRVDDRLRDLVLYLNAHSRFAVYAVELEVYEFEGLRIAKPQLFGAEVRTHVSADGSPRRKWDEKTFFEEAGRQLDKRELEAVRRLYTLANEIGARIGWGTGGKTGSFNVKVARLSSKSIYSVYTDGQFVPNFKWLDTTGEAIAFRRRLAPIGLIVRERRRSETRA